MTIYGHIDPRFYSLLEVRGSPGGDDNASSLSILLEVLQAMAHGGYDPSRSIEFHFYGCEEAQPGNEAQIGSRIMASDYRQRRVNVVGMLNMDMVGYQARMGQEISLMGDFISPLLFDLTVKMVQSYTDRNVTRVSCQYACSDHASWFKQGYSTAMVTEAGPHQTVGEGPGVPNPEAERLNPAYHSPGDTSSTVNREYLTQFTKLAMAWGVEMSFVRPRHPPSSFDQALQRSATATQGMVGGGGEAAVWALLVAGGIGLGLLVAGIYCRYIGRSGRQPSYDSVPGSCPDCPPQQQLEACLELEELEAATMSPRSAQASTHTVMGVVV